MAKYSVKAGSGGQNERSLPFISGSATYATDIISNDLRAKLDEYVQVLLKLKPHTVHGQLVKGFFAPSLGDCEVEPDI
jgi:bud emergence protein 1